ncbi:hypothetical protein J6590_013454 [Homalodisca vitripennis]|nr:hypothetical protein J6590_013454 [Homalodisca vitripennis]
MGLKLIIQIRAFVTAASLSTAVRGDMRTGSAHTNNEQLAAPLACSLSLSVNSSLLSLIPAIKTGQHFVVAWKRACKQTDRQTPQRESIAAVSSNPELTSAIEACKAPPGVTELTFVCRPPQEISFFTPTWRLNLGNPRRAISLIAEDEIIRCKGRSIDLYCGGSLLVGLIAVATPARFDWIGWYRAGHPIFQGYRSEIHYSRYSFSRISTGGGPYPYSSRIYY